MENMFFVTTNYLFQIAVDLFAMGSQYQDIATLSGMSKFSAGQIQQFPGYHVEHNQAMAAKFENALRLVGFHSKTWKQ